MKAIGAAILSLTALASASRTGGLQEEFDYPDGNLTVVSGGAWKLWRPDAFDAIVENGSVRDIPTPSGRTTDVIREFPAVLTNVGDSATFSFDLDVHSLVPTDHFGISFVPVSTPYFGNTNYRQGLTIRAFSFGPDLFEYWVDTYESNIVGHVLFTPYFTQGSVHQVAGEVFRINSQRVQFSISFDGGVPLRGITWMEDSRGWNAVEIFTRARHGVPVSRLDNLQIQDSSGPTTVAPTSYYIAPWFGFDGDLASLYNSDDDRLRSYTGSASLNFAIEFKSTLPPGDVSELRFELEASATRIDQSQFVSMYNYATQSYTPVHFQFATLEDTLAAGAISVKAAQYVSPTREVKSRVEWFPHADVDSGWSDRCDLALWTVN